MTYSPTGQEAEKNARLLFTLAADMGATGIGSVCGFFEVNDIWCCPSCHRRKSEIARLDKNGNLLCALHWHHDHFGDFASDRLPYHRAELSWEDAQPYDSLRNSFSRFPQTLICGDCNVADGAAKKAAGTKSDFSFTPFEISTFIIVTANAAHKVDAAKARLAYEKAQPAMSLYGENLRGVIGYPQADPDSFESVGGAAWRVLKETRAAMSRNQDKGK